MLHIISLSWPYVLIYFLGLFVVSHYNWGLNYPMNTSNRYIIFWFIYLPAFAIKNLCRRTMHRNKYLRYLVYKRIYHDLHEKKISLKANKVYGYCWSLEAVAPWYMSGYILDYKELIALKPLEPWLGGWWFNPYDRYIRMQKLREIINAY